MVDCKHQAENATRVARSFQLWELAPKPHTSSRRYTSPSTKQRPPTGGTSSLCHSSDLSSSSHTPSFSFLNLSLLFFASRTSSPHHIVIHSHGLLPEEHRILLCIILRFLLKMLEYSTFDKLPGHTQKKKSDPQTLRQHSWLLLWQHQRTRTWSS